MIERTLDDVARRALPVDTRLARLECGSVGARPFDCYVHERATVRSVADSPESTRFIREYPIPERRIRRTPTRTRHS